MASYRPKSVEVLQANIINGGKTAASQAKLSNWNRSLVLGIVRDVNSAIITDAAIQIIRVATGNVSTVLGVVFTDVNGEYGVSLATLTTGQKYLLEVYTPASV